MNKELPIEIRIFWCAMMGSVAIYFIASAIQILRTPKQQICFLPPERVAEKDDKEKN